MKINYKILEPKVKLLLSTLILDLGPTKASYALLTLQGLETPFRSDPFPTIPLQVLGLPKERVTILRRNQ